MYLQCEEKLLYVFTLFLVKIYDFFVFNTTDVFDSLRESSDSIVLKALNFLFSDI